VCERCAHFFLVFVVRVFYTCQNCNRHFSNEGLGIMLYYVCGELDGVWVQFVGLE